MQIASHHPFGGLEAVVTENVGLAPYTWYKLGGPARYFVRPRDLAELQLAVRRCGENGIPMYVLGRGANLLVSDGGVDGAVFYFHETPYWEETTIDGNTVTAGCGKDLQKLLLQTARSGLAGLERMAGIPGTIGGGIRMNAGGKYGDLGSVVERVRVMDSEGVVFDRLREDLIFDYRKTNIAAPFILGATLRLEEDDPDAVAARTKEIWMYKRNTQPLNGKNCGCVFKNPRRGVGGATDTVSAGALIDESGLKGFRIGGAEVSDKHANFIVAHPGCTSADVQNLIAAVRERVADKTHIELESEVRIWP
ncbi:MAG TPA: UDP-N-acetylmuramate dehydrogenase [Tepidisphaeraceae bacterium]|jgi:UDP-N-acetylmuramate dehydrogenase